MHGWLMSRMVVAGTLGPSESFFAWEATWAKILTLNQLQRRGWRIPNKCYMCKEDEESNDYILLDCETPLLHAARQGHTVTAKYLLDHGADPAIPSDLGATALHHSAGIGDIELLRFLLSKGVDIDSQSDAGTPLIWAAGHGQHDAVKVLLEHHANAYVFTLHPIFYEDRYCSKYLELAVSLLPHVQ
ncbi:Histone-lysine N-methyltransferase EHMT2 [Vitis vinifera]|uniref:Histone-lysine N-methyltransferase EHMT2 n=1 Tax=Vitis vinifera TaxID=29760 RepID=A0A438IHP0_VITVI|nr:Histone-lysine N-methyltransferase EHMT2 [Vitis vinifera]